MLDWIDWGTVLTALGNLILNSIPEETFLVMFCLLLINQFDFLSYKSPKTRRFQKYDLALMCIPILSVAIVSNILRFSNIDLILVPVISFFVCLIAIVITYKLYFNIFDILKAFVCLLIGFIVLMIIESLYIPALLYITGSTVKDMNSSLLTNFVCSLPAKMIQFLVILYIYLRKSTILKANVFKAIMSSRVLQISTTCLLLFNFILILILSNLIGFKKALISLPFNVQAYIIVSMLLFPMVNLSTYFGCIYYKTNKDAQDRYLLYLYIKNHIEHVRNLSKKGKYESFQKAVMDIENYAEEALLKK